jgi:hypothetical protein
MPALSLAQTPTQSQPPSQPPAGQPPTSPTEQPQPSTAASPQVDKDAAKQHLTAARNSLSQMTQMPEAAQLTGDARTQVSELISNFNTLISTPTNWSAAYAKVEANVTSLIGPKGATDEPAPRTGTEGAVGTTGPVTLNPELKAKLVEFRGHLERFEEAAGGARTDDAQPAAAPASGAPAAAAPAAAAPATAEPPAHASTMSRDEAMQHIQAIETLLGGNASAPGTPGAAPSTSPVTLDAAKVEQLRSHIAELKRIIGQR